MFNNIECDSCCESISQTKYYTCSKCFCRICYKCVREFILNDFNLVCPSCGIDLDVISLNELAENNNLYTKIAENEVNKIISNPIKYTKYVNKLIKFSKIYDLLIIKEYHNLDYNRNLIKKQVELYEIYLTLHLDKSLDYIPEPEFDINNLDTYDSEINFYKMNTNLNHENYINACKKMITLQNKYFKLNNNPNFINKFISWVKNPMKFEIYLKTKVTKYYTLFNKLTNIKYFSKCYECNTGYLEYIDDSTLKCNCCNKNICMKCLKPITTKHKCKKDDISTSEYIFTNTTPCPNCFTRIAKDGGCNDITCKNCNTKFDIRTGEIIKFHIHDPSAKADDIDPDLNKEVPLSRCVNISDISFGNSYLNALVDVYFINLNATKDLKYALETFKFKLFVGLICTMSNFYTIGMDVDVNYTQNMVMIYKLNYLIKDCNNKLDLLFEQIVGLNQLYNELIPIGSMFPIFNNALFVNALLEYLIDNSVITTFDELYTKKNRFNIYVLGLISTSDYSYIDIIDTIRNMHEIQLDLVYENDLFSKFSKQLISYDNLSKSGALN